jgi:NTP pyrophosphatase (non-canonical NTP hydrolase)
MTFEEYQRRAAETAQYAAAAALAYVALGLASEAGEVAGVAKRLIRDDGGVITEARREAMQKELGDVLWYVARIASEWGLSLENVAQGNLDKLADRAARNVIKGEGDAR